MVFNGFGFGFEKSEKRKNRSWSQFSKNEGKNQTRPDFQTLLNGLSCILVVACPKLNENLKNTWRKTL